MLLAIIPMVVIIVHFKLKHQIENDDNDGFVSFDAVDMDAFEETANKYRMDVKQSWSKQSCCQCCPFRFLIKCCY